MRLVLCLLFCLVSGCATARPRLDACYIPETGLAARCEPLEGSAYLLPFDQAVCFSQKQFKPWLESFH